MNGADARQFSKLMSCMVTRLLFVECPTNEYPYALRTAQSCTVSLPLAYAAVKYEYTVSIGHVRNENTRCTSIPSGGIMTRQHVYMLVVFTQNTQSCIKYWLRYAAFTAAKYM